MFTTPGATAMTPEEGKAEIVKITEEALRKIDGIGNQVFKGKSGCNGVDDLHFDIEKRLRKFEYDEDAMK
jgi:hypothetical protein